MYEKHERMVAGRHWAESTRTWKRRTSFQVMIKQSQRKEEAMSLGQTAKNDLRRWYQRFGGEMTTDSRGLMDFQY